MSGNEADAGSIERSRAIVIVPQIRERTVHSAPSAEPRDTFVTAASQTHSITDRLEEACGLARALDLTIVETTHVPIQAPKPATLFGSGKVEQFKQIIADKDVHLAIIDHAITPVQQRNLEVAWNTKVLDRTGLILEIFGDRARTREGRLQVELAHLTYQKGRLVRAWTHLERQRGGNAFIGGPGEAQIELDRRMIDGRIESIKRELSQVVKTRELHRAGRRKVPYPIVALVGYTNAGKSTLFNRVTGSTVTARDQVFATLDPTMREVQLDCNRRIILSDTVGFISDLPTMLVAAFRATLEEVVEADLILHVRDIAHPESEAQRTDVENILNDLGINTHAANRSIVEVWNKTDLLSPGAFKDASFLRRQNEIDPVLVSAVTGYGIENLLARVGAHFRRSDVEMRITIAAEDGKMNHWVHEHARIISKTTSEDGTNTFHISIAPDHAGRLSTMMDRKKLSNDKL